MRDTSHISCPDYSDWMQSADESGLVGLLETRSIGTPAISLMRLQQTQVFPDPATPDISIQLCISGRIERLRGNTGFGKFDSSAGPGDFLVGPANSPIDIEGEGDFELLICVLNWSQIQDHIQNILQSPFDDFGRLHAEISTNPKVNTFVECMWTQLSQKEQTSRLVVDQLLNRLIRSLVTMCGREIPGAGQRSKLTPRQHCDVLEYMNEHFGDVLQLDSLADVAGLSRFHFARQFTNTTGESPIRLLRRIRIEKAQRLLANPESSIASIALECGFCDQAHLTRIFKAATRITPSQYRREVLGKTS